MPKELIVLLLVAILLRHLGEVSFYVGLDGGAVIGGTA